MPRFALALVLLVCACSPREPDGFTSDPLITVGHGAFIAADGTQITPDVSFVKRAQGYYIKSLRERGRNSETLDFDKTRRLINSTVKDQVLADAIYIEWLIGAVEPPNAATLTIINNALRWHYLDVLNKREWTPDERAWKGIGKDLAEILRKRGVKVQASIAVGGDEYIRSCAAAGVPIPPPVFSAGWNNRGAIVNPFLAPDMTAEVMHFQSTNPEGACLALPRYPDGSDRADVFGLICVGKVSRNACFWDNPTGIHFQKNIPVPIDEFVGGIDLVANGQGECSDCHAGENPYVIHPDNPPFQGITADIMPSGWYRPLVFAGWSQNPGPTSVLDGISSTQRCSSCHFSGGAGRFPDASKAITPGWCRDVFPRAVGSFDTMPPDGFGPKSDYDNHIKAIKNLCDRDWVEPEVTPAGGLADNPGFISPPVVFDPIYACGTKVAVRSGIYDAKITLTVNGAAAGSKLAKNPNFEEFTVAALQIGDIVAASQEFQSVSSAPSADVTVRDHKVDYPGGLPTPSVFPELIHECARVLAVRNVPSATITVFTNGAFPSSGIASTDWSAIGGGKTPFVINDAFTVEQSLCADTSPRSTAVVKAVAQPAVIHAPTFNPPMIYSGQQLTTLESLVHGALVQVREGAFGPLGSVQTPVNWFPGFDVATPLGRPLNLSDQLIAMQGLCTKGPDSAIPPAVRCEALPPPHIAQPWVGATFVVVLQSVPGARVHVFDSGGTEIGDGSGTVIPLSRAIVGGDVLTAVQQIGDCTSRMGYVVTVPK